MTQTADQMELPEEAIRKHYPAALSMLEGFEHSPRIAASGPVAEKSAGLGTRRRFRSTTPGLATRRTVARDGVQVLAVDGGDGTAQMVLTALYRQSPFEVPPLLALLPSGTTSSAIY